MLAGNYLEEVFLVLFGITVVQQAINLNVVSGANSQLARWNCAIDVLAIALWLELGTTMDRLSVEVLNFSTITRVRAVLDVELQIHGEGVLFYVNWSCITAPSAAPLTVVWSENLADDNAYKLFWSRLFQLAIDFLAEPVDCFVSAACFVGARFESAVLFFLIFKSLIQVLYLLSLRVELLRLVL